MNICLCGCGSETKKKYVKGHNRRGKTQTPESKLKISIAVKLQMSNPEIRAKVSVALKGNTNAKGCMFNWKNPDAARAKMSARMIGNTLGKNPSENTRAKMSIAASKRISNINQYVRGKKGLFFSLKNNKEIKYDSSWELEAYQILELLSDVKSYDRCQFYINYNINNSLHKYIPDIFAEYKTGKKKIIEIKPLYATKSEKNQAKFLAAYEYCKNEKGITFHVWTEDELFLK